MSIARQFTTVSRQFVAIIIGLSILSVGLLAFVLYETNHIRFSGDVSPDKLHSVIEDHPAVVEYLEDEKDYEAHFVTIASLIKQDQQQALGRALVMATIPVILVASLLGYIVARYLLRPVRESYESQERFLQDAAHELRNPLAAMSLALENVGKNKADEKFVTTMRRQTKRLIRVNEDLLFLERRTPGAEIKPINISELLADILEDLQLAITSKKLDLKVDIQPNITYKIDQKDFIKLSRNIVENAIKYSKTGKQLTIKLKQSKRIEMIVQDQGIGIPKSDLTHIGERFYRSENVGNIDGTGLGMAIVQKVLNVYGGDLLIASKEGHGTTVTVTL